MKNFKTGPDGEPTVYGWTSKLDSDTPKWRGWRAHLIAVNCGLGHWGNGQRKNFEADIECSLLPPRMHSFGIGLGIEDNSDGKLKISVYGSRLFNLWVSFSGVLPSRDEYHGRTTGFVVAKDHGTWNVWAKTNEWSVGTPWWRHTYINWERLLFGKSSMTEKTMTEGTTIVPMPEANYPATFKTTRAVFKWKTRLGPIRPEKVHYCTEVVPGKPVPIPGKGENSWDCDDDALFSISVQGESVEKAVASLVESALGTRARYGGQHMSVPQGTAEHGGMS